jgi:hypothetical protein
MVNFNPRGNAKMEVCRAGIATEAAREATERVGKMGGWGVSFSARAPSPVARTEMGRGFGAAEPPAAAAGGESAIGREEHGYTKETVGDGTTVGGTVVPVDNVSPEEEKSDAGEAMREGRRTELAFGCEPGKKRVPEASLRPKAQIKQECFTALLNDEPETRKQVLIIASRDSDSISAINISIEEASSDEAVQFFLWNAGGLLAEVGKEAAEPFKCGSVHIDKTGHHVLLLMDGTAKRSGLTGHQYRFQVTLHWESKPSQSLRSKTFRVLSKQKNVRKCDRKTRCPEYYDWIGSIRCLFEQGEAFQPADRFLTDRLVEAGALMKKDAGAHTEAQRKTELGWGKSTRPTKKRQVSLWQSQHLHTQHKHASTEQISPFPSTELDDESFESDLGEALWEEEMLLSLAKSI